jgi:hypothetical protein
MCATPPSQRKVLATRVMRSSGRHCWTSTSPGYDDPGEAQWYRPVPRLSEEITTLPAMPECKPGMIEVSTGTTIMREWEAVLRGTEDSHDFGLFPALIVRMGKVTSRSGRRRHLSHHVLRAR